MVARFCTPPCNTSPLIIGKILRNAMQYLTHLTQNSSHIMLLYTLCITLAGFSYSMLLRTPTPNTYPYAILLLYMGVAASIGVRYLRTEPTL